MQAFEQLRFNPPLDLSARNERKHRSCGPRASFPEVERELKEKPSSLIQRSLSLPPDHNFVDAIAALISDASLPPSGSG